VNENNKIKMRGITSSFNFKNNSNKRLLI